MKCTGTIFLLLLLTVTSHANQPAIELKPGYWEVTQNTVVNGDISVPEASVSDGYCLLESQSTQSLPYYVERFRRGLGEDTKCDISNLMHKSKKVNFDLHCADGQAKSENKIEYRYSHTRVDITSNGVISAAGKQLNTVTTGIAQWSRICTEKEEKIAAVEAIRLTGRNDEAFNSNFIPQKNMAKSKPKARKTKGIPEPIKHLDANNFFNEFQAIKTDKPIIVHFTSTDDSCPPCIKNNRAFFKAREILGDDYVYAQVVFNPWRTFQKGFKRLRALPATNIYLDKIELASIKGQQEDLAKSIRDTHQWLNQTLSGDYSDVTILKPEVSQIDKLIESSKKQNKPLLINISSDLSDCPACVKANPLFRYGAKELNKDVIFAEITYNPHSDVKNDAILDAYLKKYNLKVKGLPVTLIFNQGKSMGARPGPWPTLTNDINRLLNKAR